MKARWRHRRHDGRVTILDFGLVGEAGDDGRVRDGVHAGTPAYMAPERVAGQPATEASDWYSVAVMLFEAIAGRRPALQERANRQQLDSALAELDDVSPTDRERLTDAVLAMVRSDQSRRPQPGELERALGIATRALPSERPPDDVAPEARLLGREKELATLHAEYRRARGGSTCVVFVLGGVGLGKSALLGEFAEGLAADVVRLEGRCSDCESLPFNAVDSLVDAVVHHLRTLPQGEQRMIVPTHTGSIARMFPAFDELRDPSTQDEVPPDAREVRRRAATTLREVLRRIAVARPTVVLLDDLQWTDRDSASFLAQVLSPPDSPPLLFIGAACTNENGDDPELVSVLSALLQTVPERLGLVPLAEGPSSLLAKAALSAHGVDSAPLAEAIARASRGVPLVILEMAFDCSQPERIADDADAWLSRARGRRLAGLDAMSGEALELLALADRPISEAVLDQALTEPSREDVPAWSRTLRGARLARRCRGGRIELLPIARDVALARIMPSVRAARHRRLALAYEHSADGEAAATTRASRSRAACSRTWASRSRAAASARSSSC